LFIMENDFLPYPLDLSVFFKWHTIEIGWRITPPTPSQIRTYSFPVSGSSG
jgi:hypothetical protein